MQASAFHRKIPMKLKRTHLSLRTAAASLILGSAPVVHAASDSWIPGADGDYTDSANWQGGNVPDGAGDIATISGSGSIAALSSNITLQALELAHSADGTPVFNQSGGVLGTGTLRFGSAVASRNPTYNLGGGEFNVSSLSWGSGDDAHFNVSGGIANFGPGAINIGGTGEGHLNISSGTFNHTVSATGQQLQIGTNGNSTGNVVISGGSLDTGASQVRFGNNPGGAGNVELSGSGVFNATATTGDLTIFLGNNSGSGNLTLSEESHFNAPGYSVVLGQFGTGFGHLTIEDDATLTAARLVFGGVNVGSPATGAIDLDGGTIVAGTIQLGSSNQPPSSSAHVLRANGGTIRAIPHAANNNFFGRTSGSPGIYVDLQAGGLNFDTNGNNVTIPAVATIAGSGNLVKQGEGSLTIVGGKTYTGDTIVQEGALIVQAAFFDDDSHIEVADDATLHLDHELMDVIESLKLGDDEITSGIWGAVGSGAPNESPLLAGSGRLLVGEPLPEGRDLVWIGEFENWWSNLPMDANFIVEGDTEPVFFAAGDNVLFDDRGNYDFGVTIDGTVQPGVATFDTGTDFTLNGNFEFSGIGGAASIVKNNTNTVTLGGAASSFTGPISVNAGRLIVGEHQGFGASSGISIAAGAQVDLNGRQPGAIYSYTLNGPGPDGEGAIVSGAHPVNGINSATGVRFLILNADSTIGSDTYRFDIAGGGGSITGVGGVRTLTKIGSNEIAIRGPSTNVNYEIRGGTVWAEGPADAFGDASNTLTVGGGAIAGSFGNLTIPVQVVLEDGAILTNHGTGTGTWTGGISVDGAFTLGAAQSLILNGSVSGEASMTKTGGGSVTIGQAPGWTGDTTVTNGTLVLNTGGLADEGNVVLGDNAVLNLTHGQTDTVKTLTLNGAPAAAGTWGSSASDADNKNDTFFQGTGVLSVTETVTPPAGGFDEWVASFDLEGEDAESGADPDGDGIPNAVEYVLGGDPTQPSLHLLPQADSSGGDIVFTFRRNEASIDGVTSVIVQYGTGLVEWDDVPVPDDPGVYDTVTVEENGDVTVTIPKDGDTKKFVRLKVTVE